MASRFGRSSVALYQPRNISRRSNRSQIPLNNEGDEELIFPMDDETRDSECSCRCWCLQVTSSDNRRCRRKVTTQTKGGVPIRQSSISTSPDVQDMMIDEKEILDKLADQDGKLGWGWK